MTIYPACGNFFGVGKKLNAIADKNIERVSIIDERDIKVLMSILLPPNFHFLCTHLHSCFSLAARPRLFVSAQERGAKK